MGCMNESECPLMFLNNSVEWAIEDPKGKNIEKVREIRDEIERKAIELVEDLKRS